MATRYQLGCAKLFKFSRTLFTKEDGAPYTFYLAEKFEDLEQIIHKGSGELTDLPDEATFVLTENTSDCKGHLPLDFIVDCVKKNAFLDPQKYSHPQDKPSAANKPSASKATVSNDGNESDEEYFMQSSTVQLNRSALAGRSKYTDAEDMKIIRYLIVSKRHKETGGNVVWKHMEAKKVTDHTYQSMKARFAKKILPDIESYSIPPSWKRMLTGQNVAPGSSFSPASRSQRSESPEIELTFESLEAWKKGEGRKRSAEPNESSGDVNQNKTKESSVVIRGSNQSCCNNFPQDDDDLNTQELDELDQLIMHEVKTTSRVDPQPRERQPPEQEPSTDSVSPKPSSSEPRTPKSSHKKPIHSSTSTPGVPEERCSHSPPVKRAKKSSVLSSSSDEESSMSETFSPPKLSKFLESQSVMGPETDNQAASIAPLAGTSREEPNNMDITKRRISVLSQMYGLSTEQAIQLLITLDGDFLAALLYLEKAV